MAVLYRDYRPKTFFEVINQEHIKTTLQKAVANGTFAHAYLFAGMRGTGKTSIARIFARAVNCQNQKSGEPCNKCEICKQFLDNSGLDLIEIDAASNTGVENIREIIEHLKFSPTQAKYKVFIIDEVHMLSKGAFNALLKTLEEPPKHALFILATTEIHKVPATVVSRTQRFDFKKIENRKLLEYLEEVAKKEKIKIDKASLELVVNSAEGSVRDALSILDKLSTFDSMDLEQTEKLLGITNVLAAQKFLDILEAKDAAGALDFLQELFAGGVDPVQFNKDFLEYLRKVLMISMGAKVNFALDQTQQENLKKHAQEIKPTQLLYVIRLFLRANKDFQICPNVELPMEIAAAESCLGQGMGQASLPKPELKKKPEAADLGAAVARAAKLGAAEMESELIGGGAKIISEQEIFAAWLEIMGKLKDSASTLYAIMKNGEVKSVENNVITVGFAYKFHKDSLDNKKNRDALLKILEDHFKTKFAITAVIGKPEDEQGVDTASAALEVFGSL